MIQIKSLYKSFEDRTVLNDINFIFENGKTNLIIGQSGSGKTVLMKCLVGLLTPEKGEVLYDGRNLITMGKKEKKAFLIGGGIGIPPMLQLAKELNCEKQIILGFRDELFLMDEFKQQGRVYVATEDGSAGTEGNVLDAIRENGLDAEIIYACGPMPMLRALKEYAEKNHIECWISMEERMACGIGACLACVCQSKEKDAHSNVKNKRICKEGPVFRAEEVEF